MNDCLSCCGNGILLCGMKCMVKRAMVQDRYLCLRLLPSHKHRHVDQVIRRSQKLRLTGSAAQQRTLPSHWMVN